MIWVPLKGGAELVMSDVIHVDWLAVGHGESHLGIGGHADERGREGAVLGFDRIAVPAMTFVFKL